MCDNQTRAPIKLRQCFRRVGSPLLNSQYVTVTFYSVELDPIMLAANIFHGDHR
jgi:hypothetical protein